MADTDVPRTYPQGVPSWIDLETPDATAIAPFYEAVLGWTLTDAMPPGAPGHYLIATIDGKDVAAIASGVASIGTDAAWNTYLAVDDADASRRRGGGGGRHDHRAAGGHPGRPAGRGARSGRARRSGSGRRAAASVRSS